MRQFTAQPLQDQPFHLCKVDDIAAQAVIVQQRLKQTVLDAQPDRPHQPLQRRIQRQHPPVPIQRHRRIRGMTLQHPIDRLPHRRQVGLRQTARAIGGRKPGG